MRRTPSPSRVAIEVGAIGPGDIEARVIEPRAVDGDAVLAGEMP